MKTILITGSSGFIGTNLTKLLLEQGHKVIGMDNFSSSEKWKSELFADNPNYKFIEADITKNISDLITEEVHEIFNLACPASPPRYRDLPLETIDVCTIGVRNVLEIAKKYNAKLLHTSTSEVYGDPLEHPQKESYRGNVNIVGERSCYDEAKRLSETICYEYKNLFNIDVKIVRIFNTYGPYMDPQDGRVITNFIQQALQDKDITMYGNGEQTRSFQYIDDLLNAFLKFMARDRDFWGPVNLGNPEEFTMNELAEIVLEKIPASKSKVIKVPVTSAYKDDPKQRKPDITLAKNELNWEPTIKLKEGLIKTIEYYKDLIAK